MYLFLYAVDGTGIGNKHISKHYSALDVPTAVPGQFPLKRELPCVVPGELEVSEHYMIIYS